MSIPIIWLIIAAGVAVFVAGAIREPRGLCDLNGAFLMALGVVILLAVASYKLGAWIG